MKWRPNGYQLCKALQPPCHVAVAADPGSTQVRNSAAATRGKWMTGRGSTLPDPRAEVAPTTSANATREANHDALVRCIKLMCSCVNRIVEISDSGGTEERSGIFASRWWPRTQRRSQGARVPEPRQVCRIGTHLFHFAEYVNALRGWVAVCATPWAAGMSVARPTHWPPGIEVSAARRLSHADLLASLTRRHQAVNTRRSSLDAQRAEGW